ncbi:SEC15 [Candida pseudojiufengensis]|uniref:SEC15 n=1 Tax=Candida pseudojiufengensis TaxID=497109 RepID=UPI0022247E52|nr:SEC15 [Candida pseudojiufengensis]KAI5965664.1 SEC15 [Candida pseudojiufengensis]
MAPSTINETHASNNGQVKQNGVKNKQHILNQNKPTIDSMQLENLLLRDEEIFQTSLNSDDYLDSLAPIIKNAVKSNGLSDLILKLNEIVKSKDEELNQQSMESMDEINLCMSHISNIHKDAENLRNHLALVSQTFNKSSIELMSRKKNYIKYKDVCNRISETQVVLNECIQVLELMNRILDLIKQTKYFSALKLIDEIVNIHIQKVNEFSFAKKIISSIPHLTKMVKDDAFENLTKWLSLNLERKLHTVGNNLYDNLFFLQETWDQIKRKNLTYLPYKLNSPVELSLRDPESNYDIFEDETLQIPLNSVYDAILVYRTLNELDNLKHIYNKEFMKKYTRIIYPLTSASANIKEIKFDEKELDEYLRKISAFFVMDKQLNLLTKFQLRTNTQADELWKSYVSKLKPILLYNLRNNDFYDLSDLSNFKNIIGDFLQIMDSNEYDISDLYEVMMVILKNHFAPLLVQDFRKKYLVSMQKELYTTLTVYEDTYTPIMKTIFYRKDEPFAPNNIKTFPVHFPFSEDYVAFCKYLRQIINSCINFIRDYYNYEINEINNIIVYDIIETFLSDKKGYGIAGEIEEFISKNANNQEVISQSFVNLQYYLSSLYETGPLINSKLRQNTGMGIHNIDHSNTFTLKAVESFIKLKKFSEDMVYTMVDNKIKGLLEMVEYDDYLPTTKNVEANFNIKDFAMFLENLFTSIFQNLPSQLRTLGLFRTYDFISQQFLNLLKDSREFNQIFIHNFDLDIKYLEQSMQKLSHNDQEQAVDDTSGNVAIESTFSELRQSINLLSNSSQFDEFLQNNQFRMRQFPALKFEDGKLLISKMKGTRIISAGSGINRSFESNGSSNRLDSSR